MTTIAQNTPPLTEVPLIPAEEKLSFIDKLTGTFSQMFDNIINGLPDIGLGIIILIVGLIIATILKKIIVRTLKSIKFDEILNSAGIGSIFTKVGIKNGITEPLGKIIFWIVMLFIIKNAADRMGVEDISSIINSLIAFLPKVIIATIIMLFGFMIADIIRNAVYSALDNLGLDYSKALAGIIFGFVFVIVLTVALSQLGIETELLKDSVKIILLSLGLGLAICLGLGLKGMANQIVSGVYARDIFKVGTTIEYEGEEAKVAGVGPVTTKLVRLDGGFIIVPNDKLISKEVRGKSAE